MNHVFQFCNMLKCYASSTSLIKQGGRADHRCTFHGLCMHILVLHFHNSEDLLKQI
jgi:superfamily I DNA/RNA helicase